jgi:hypothetical protein
MFLLWNESSSNLAPILWGGEVGIDSTAESEGQNTKEATKLCQSLN